MRAGVLLLCFAPLTACMLVNRPSEPAPPLISPEDLDQLRGEKAALAALSREQKEEIARLQLELLAKDAELEKLKRSQTVQEKRLDESSHKAQRAETKLRRLPCPPCAASRMAEVETALNALPAGSEDAKSAPQVSEAARLLQLSSQAYESDDFVKSIELADQAQQLIDAVASASQDQTAARPPAAKERPFKSAISLRVRVRSNLRVGPTRQSKVVAVLEPGTTVEARSYQGQWVRVKTRDGQSGWIFRTLLTE